MLRRIALALLLASLLPLGRATGDDAEPKKGGEEAKPKPAADEEFDPAKTKLPFSPIEKTEKGHWLLLTGRQDVGSGLSSSSEHTVLFKTTKVVAQVEATISSSHVSKETTRAGGGVSKAEPEKTETASLKDGPNVTRLLALLPVHVGKDAKFSRWRVEDEARTVHGKELSCKKVSFRFTWASERITGDKTTAYRQTTDVSIWLSADVKAPGIVALESSFEATGYSPAHGKLELQVRGFGSGEKTEWGKSKDELDKAGSEPKKKD